MEETNFADATFQLKNSTNGPIKRLQRYKIPTHICNKIHAQTVIIRFTPELILTS